MIYIKNTKTMGRGIFALQNIKKGTTIEVSPILLFQNKEIEDIGSTDISYYWYGIDKNHWALALGTGSLYNHSNDPNAKWSINKRKLMIRFVAKRDIKKNTQIFINYGYMIDNYA